MRQLTPHARKEPAHTAVAPWGGWASAGSHTVLALLEHGARVNLIDNLSNSFVRVFDHMKRLAGDKAGHMVFTQVCGTARAIIFGVQQACSLWCCAQAQPRPLVVPHQTPCCDRVETLGAS